MQAIQLPTVSTDTFEHYMAQIQRFDILSREQEYDLAVKHQKQGDIQAAHQLICSNLRFVVKIAQEYRGYGIKMLDLVQEGNIGLMMAVKKFEPEKGFRLISYAVWWIRAYIHNFIIRSWSLVKIGTTQAQKKLFFKLNQTVKNLKKGSDRVDSKKIAQELSVRDDEVEEMAIRMAARDSSLDVQLVEGNDYTLSDTLADERDNQEQLLLEGERKHLLSNRVNSAMSSLNEREKHIIHDRILSDSPRTLQELADEYGISRERVRQVERNALKKIEKSLSSQDD